jgi:hypothetical protein
MHMHMHTHTSAAHYAHTPFSPNAAAAAAKRQSGNGAVRNARFAFSFDGRYNTH